MHTSTTSQIVKLGIATGRSAPSRFLQVDMSRLTPRQQTIVSNLLPVHEKSGVPLLKAPGNNPRSMECWYKIGDDEIEPLSFKFDVPPQVCDDDAPALIDRWDAHLQEAREKMAKRLARRAAGLPSPGRKAKAKTETEAPSRASPVDAAGEAERSDIPHATEEASADTDAINAELSAIGDASEEGSAGNWADRETQAAIDEGKRKAGVAPRIGDYLADIYTKLPLLTEFMVEELRGPDAIVLPDGAVWQALARITRFDRGGWAVSSVADALDAHFGPEWKVSDRVEDIDFRLEQARELLIATWVEFQEVQSTNPAQKKGRKHAQDEGSAPRHDPAHMQRMPETMDLVRQIRVDLSTALSIRDRIYPSLGGQPAWVATVVENITTNESRLTAVTDSSPLSEIRDLYEQWAVPLAAVKPNNQLSLFAVGSEKGFQRTLEHQVRRARMWADLIKADAGVALAALALVRIIS